MGTDTFLVKLRRQIGEASDDAILLSAELLTLHALPLANFTAAEEARAHPGGSGLDAGARRSPSRG